MPDNDTYQRLITLLDTTQTPYQLIDHEPDGTTDSVSALRGHPASQAAKCIILRVKTDKKTTRHVLAVVPGDRRVDLDAVAFDPDLELVADPAIIARPQFYFNAARLDRSAAISGADYARLAQPRIEPIAGPEPGEAREATPS
ncbi:YbaK/EbsC family protein [Streptomyces sp. NPDC051636]|uniref:YbaK/EbsC family protein n=1 Tax=Streptomyces sp. NPDC051636 TaxID=3365663 RepID=UPI00378AD221